MELIVSLLYLNIFRLDIAYVVNLMARFMYKPYVEHLHVDNKILRYIMGTKDLTLKFTKLPSFVLPRFFDFNYGGDKDDRKSTYTYVFNIRSGVISWSSKKQPIVTLSTIEL